MGIKIFRDDNWNRITSGAISRKDIMHLDGEKDRELIEYLIAHAHEACRSSMIKYAAEKYGIDGPSEPRLNIDDPKDTFFWEYTVLREQVVRECDRDALKAAVLYSSDCSVAAFAFCRLTGYRFPTSECDAYAYRTFNCGIMPGITTEDIRKFCRMIIKKGGPLKDVAEDCLRNRKNTD